MTLNLKKEHKKRRWALCPGTNEHDFLTLYAENRRHEREKTHIETQIEYLEKQLKMYQTIAEVQEEQENEIEILELLVEHNIGIATMWEAKYNTLNNQHP
jgi:hypothetical protein